MKKIKNLIVNLYKGEFQGYIGKIIDFYKFIRVSILSKKIYLKSFKCKKKVFIDLGANTGQAYNFFNSFFVDYDFFLVEPNNECITKLQELKKNNSKITIINKAAYIEDGYKDFFKNDINFFQGASIEEFHNINMNTKDINYKKIETFNFINFFKKISKEYDLIILKMDIEGSEYKILDELIKIEEFKKIEYLFIEFHSYLYSDIQSKLFYKKKEKIFIKYFKSNKIGYILW